MQGGAGFLPSTIFVHGLKEIFGAVPTPKILLIPVIV